MRSLWGSTLEIIILKLRAIIGKLYKAEVQKQLKYTFQVQRTSGGDLVWERNINN